MTAPVVQESLLAISDLVVQSLFRYGKTERARALTESQGASRAETGSKSKTETTTTPACEENSHNHRRRGESLESHRHARAPASSRREGRKDAIDQVGVRGDAARGAANSR